MNTQFIEIRPAEQQGGFFRAKKAARYYIVGSKNKCIIYKSYS